MTHTTQEERDRLRLGWDRDGPLCRAINDADRLAAIERRVRELADKVVPLGHKDDEEVMVHCSYVREQLLAIIHSPGVDK